MEENEKLTTETLNELMAQYFELADKAGVPRGISHVLESKNHIIRAESIEEARNKRNLHNEAVSIGWRIAKEIPSYSWIYIQDYQCWIASSSREYNGKYWLMVSFAKTPEHPDRFWESAIAT